MSRGPASSIEYRGSGECAMVIDEITTIGTLDLEAWKSIPASSPMWDEIDRFIEGLRGIAAAKLVEREAGRNALREVLADLSSEFSEELEYFEARATLW